MNGSAFDGLDLDLVAYSLGLLQSDDATAVLNGTRVLRALAYHRSAAVRNDAFRRIGITIGWSPNSNFRLMLAIYAVLAGTVSIRVCTQNVLESTNYQMCI